MTHRTTRFATPRLLLRAFLFAALLTGCGGDGPCGDGDVAGAFCAYPATIVIEGGFSCPAGLPVRFDFGDVAFCGPEGSSFAEARDACTDAGFECGPPSCRVAPSDEDCVPGPGSCDVPRRFGYATEAAAEASCDGECAVCPEHVVAGGAIVTWMVIEAADCPCPIPTELEMLSCMEADLEATRQRSLLWSDPNACTADTDCVSASVDITCDAENNLLGSCPYVVHADSADELAAVMDTVAARVCPRVRDCSSGPTCAPVEPRCVAFACRPVSREGCVEDCEALGCGDCAARCLVDSPCVAAAASCDAVYACSSSPLGPLVTARAYDGAASCLEPVSVVGIIEPLATASGDITCGVGPDGRAYVFGSGSQQDALGWPDCDAATSAAALGAGDC